MKKFTMLCMLLLSAVLSFGQITSTSSGGNWSDTTTWVGHIVPTESNDVVIAGNVYVDMEAKCKNLTVNNGDTLTRDGYPRTLYVTGDLTNNGVITKESFTIDITGNAVNNGVWEQGGIQFSGTNDNTISMAAGKSYDEIDITKSDTNSFLIIGSDSKYNQCRFNYYGKNYNNIRIKSGSNYVLDLMKTSTLNGIRFNGSGSELKGAVMADSYYGVPSYIENVKLKGKTVIAGGNVHFINSNIIVEDTLTRDGYPRTLYVTGDLTNNGVITKESFTIDITGNAVNNGVWEQGTISMNGTTDQTFNNADSLYAGFRLKANVSSATTWQWYKNDTAVSGATNAEYAMSKSTADDDLYGVYYCQTDAGKSRKISLQKGNSANTITSTTSGGYWKDTSTWIGGIIPLENDDVVIDGNVILDGYGHACNNLTINPGDTLYNIDRSSNNLKIYGDILNNGAVLTYSDYTLYPYRNIINNGTWNTYKISLEYGTTDEKIEIKGPFTFSPFIRINANVENASSWQWFKDGQAISGATGSRYYLHADEDYAGKYYCQTDAGDSRKITVVKGNSGGVVLKEHFDGETFPPAGWTQKITNSAHTWKKGNPSTHPFTEIDSTNVYSALVTYVAENQDEWLMTPVVNLPSGTITLEFYAGYNSEWLSNATVKLNISTDGGVNWTKLGEADNDGKAWEWRKVTADLSGYAGQSVMLAWQYVGNDGDLMAIDNVEIIEGTTGIGDHQAITDRLLSQNYPNPFTAQTRIPFRLEKKSNVHLVIYNSLGQKISEPVSGMLNAGNHKVTFDGSSLRPGIYFYRLVVDGMSTTKRMVIQE